MAVPVSIAVAARHGLRQRPNSFRLILGRFLVDGQKSHGHPAFGTSRGAFRPPPICTGTVVHYNHHFTGGHGHFRVFRRFVVLVAQGLKGCFAFGGFDFLPLGF
jgi:hypothetical protein